MTDFAITANDARIQYTASGGQTAFPYDFPIYDQAHIVATRVRAGVTTTLVIVTDYTVSGVGASGGGTVTLTSGATAGDIITLYRDVPATRATDYSESGDLFATTLNVDFDLGVMRDQQVVRDLARVLRLAPEDSLVTLNAIPSVSARAGAFATYDSSGQPSVAAAAADAPVGSAMMPVIAAVSLSAGRDAFGLEIGSDIVANSARMSSIQNIALTADQLMYVLAGTGETISATTLTHFGRTLIDDADASAARTTLGVPLGTAGAVVPLLNAANTHGGLATFSAGISLGNETFAAYDEGSFTAAISTGGGSVSLTESTLKYIKKGNEVTITGRLTVNATTGTGNMTITGLPFTVFNAISNLTAGSMLPKGWAVGLVSNLIPRPILNTTTAIVYVQAATGGYVTTNVANLLAAACDFDILLVYFTV